MKVVHSIIIVKSNLEDQIITRMFLEYSQNHVGSTYCMLNLCTKRIVISRGVIWLNKTYGEYISIKYHTKSDSSILQDEDESDNLACVKIDPVKTEDVKTEQSVKTEQDSRRGGRKRRTEDHQDRFF